MKYFLHDTSAFEDEKISELFIHFGYEGIGLFFTTLEKLAKQEKPVKTEVLKHQLNIGKRLEKCWKFMEEIGLISSSNGETFNEQLLNFSEKYKIKKEKNAKKISEWREKQTDTKNVTSYEPVCNQPKVKESKVNNKYIYSEFYDSEISQTDNSTYKDFVKFLFGQNIDKKPLYGVLSIKNQLSEKQFELLLAKCNGNKKLIGDIVTKIDNDKKYYKDKTSLYRTVLNWIEGRFLK